MTAALLDINVLIALAWPSHVHHACAHGWFSRHGRAGWATCPLTEMGFVRISSNPKIIPDAVTPQQALQVLGQMVKQGRHVFWPDDIALDAGHAPFGGIMGHRQVTDAYLLALAIHKKGRLITLDNSISALLSANDPRQGAIELIGAHQEA